MNITDAKKALESDGFTVEIDKDTTGLIELIASKNGISETFYDCNIKGFCSTYLCEFNTTDQIVAYANKSIKLYLATLKEITP